MNSFAIILAVLIGGLGSPSFKQREGCMAALTQINNDYNIQAWLKPHLKSKDPEVAMRINFIITEYNNPHHTITKFRRSWPRIDAMQMPRDNVWHYYVCQIYYRSYNWDSTKQKFVTTYIPTYHVTDSQRDDKARSLTQEYIQDLMKNGKLSRQAAVKLLDKMVQSEMKGTIAKPLDEGKQYDDYPQWNGCDEQSYFDKSRKKIREFFLK